MARPNPHSTRCFDARIALLAGSGRRAYVDARLGDIAVPTLVATATDTFNPVLLKFLSQQRQQQEQPMRSQPDTTFNEQRK